ncbi:hypothetical protein ACOMHN_016879 [Nucella lapillus]
MASLKPLVGKVCIVTGATRGIGKGIALQLGASGAIVYITGRTLKRREGDSVGGSLEETATEVEAKGGKCIPVQCDHSKDEDVKKLFDRVSNDQDGQLDVLVNNAYSAVTTIMNNLKTPFWEQDPGVWDDINNVGLRNHYVCSVLAAKMMVPRKQGLIVNVSSAGGLSYLFNVAYGVGKEACDRMAADCGRELKKHQVAFVSLWPGLVSTEHMANFVQQTELKSMLKSSWSMAETPEYAGRAVAQLAADPGVMKKSGRILLTGDLGAEYGFKDVDGSSRHSMREVGYLLTYLTGNTIFLKVLPSFVKIPCWMLSLAGNKF